MRTMTRTRGLALVGAAVVMLTTAGVGALPAGAAGHLPKKATVHITKAGVFSKTAVTVMHGSGVCTSTNYTVKFVNSSPVSQQLQEVGGPQLGGPMAPKATQVICVGIGTIHVTLTANSAATLAITVT